MNPLKAYSIFLSLVLCGWIGIAATLGFLETRWQKKSIERLEKSVERLGKEVDDHEHYFSEEHYQEQLYLELCGWNDPCEYLKP